jgi:peptidoglycan/LPS O-acetylase OafA/YrhL
LSSPAQNPSRDRWVPNLFLLLIPIACFLPSVSLIFAVLLCLFLGLITSLARLNQSCHSFWFSRPALFIGEISYSLYMTHTLAQKVLYKLLPSERFADASLWTKLIVTTGYVSVIVGFCLGVYYLVEKPSRNWFRRLLKRKQ